MYIFARFGTAAYAAEVLIVSILTYSGTVLLLLCPVIYSKIPYGSRYVLMAPPVRHVMTATYDLYQYVTLRTTYGTHTYTASSCDMDTVVCLLLVSPQVHERARHRRPLPGAVALAGM